MEEIIDYNEKSLEMHKKNKGKIEIKSKVKLENKEDLSLAYTPGVAEVSRKIAEDKNKIYDYTFKGNSVAVISDGTAVLGLGNIGAEAAMPVMEGKAILFKEFANIDAFPICLKEQNTEKTIETIKNISPVFGGINLEDFKAPECFEIESRLQDLGIPVMHDDQHGTAVVVLAGLTNALKLRGSEKQDVKIIINGSGAAGIAVAKLLLKDGFKKITMIDSKGIIHKQRDNLNQIKKQIAEVTNYANIQGDLNHALVGADVFIGVSVANLLNKEMIQSMNNNPIIFALANPVPEVMPDVAQQAGAFIIATGRSDFPNQINNVLAFPGIFRGALDIRAKRITDKMKLAAAKALANLIKPEINKILPNPLDKSVVPAIAEAVKKAYLEEIQ
ncbi:MAG: NADP-dependent malic enzyme [Nanoarchaeota archaeon]|nr:NADP-dependent malic enzyme [Nanoarchaeota archaeon]MBU4116276.1 NADP-dependent malic enzyme [Nanoarchaeota archaeon]